MTCDAQMMLGFGVGMSLALLALEAGEIRTSIREWWYIGRHK